MSETSALTLVEKLNSLDDNAQYIVLMVADYPGVYAREDLIRELRLVTGLGLKDASEAYQRARATGLIEPQFRSTYKGQVNEAGFISPAHPNLHFL